jgi:uncharacterized protein YjbI with pentapeptide repeats
MANPEHVDKLLEGVEVWNEWRYDNLGIAPALWGADLGGADLRGVDLKRADLEEADLSGADLEEAKLRDADLRGANLMGAMHLRAEQLCEAKTLYQAELDPDLESEVIKAHSHLLDKPRETTNR